MPRRAAHDRKREFTDDFIESEFYKRFMKASPLRRDSLIRALQAAHTLATEGLDQPPATPLFEATSATEAAAK
jgi:hypothetical protein